MERTHYYRGFVRVLALVSYLRNIWIKYDPIFGSFLLSLWLDEHADSHRNAFALDFRVVESDSCAIYQRLQNFRVQVYDVEAEYQTGGRVLINQYHAFQYLDQLLLYIGCESPHAFFVHAFSRCFGRHQGLLETQLLGCVGVLLQYKGICLQIVSEFQVHFNVAGVR